MHATAKTPRTHIRTIATTAAPWQVLSSLRNTRFPAVLESSLPAEPFGRYSIFARDPITIVEIPPCGLCPEDPLARLGSALGAGGQVEAGGPDVPFAGAWIGFITYEAGLASERISPAAHDDVPLPAARFALYDAAAVYDHRNSKWTLVATECPSRSMDAGHAQRRLDELETLMRGAERLSPTDPVWGAPGRTAIAVANLTPAAYRAKVRRAIRYIRAGDMFQVNLTQRFSTDARHTPWELYDRLRRVCPSPFAAFLPYDDFAVLSASPELFLQLRNGRIITRPIKGTRPRGRDVGEDHRLRRELAASEKDRAELNMIIDLLRNDLGRVCEFGSVRVLADGAIESHPNVFHRVATVEARLADGSHWEDLLRATFPGGSITGAPKIRATQIITELEPTTRGVYCGAIGWIGLDGSATFNLAIRTMIHTGRDVHAYAGGAITADSDPDDEYREMLAKAEGMLLAMGCVVNRSTEPRARQRRGTPLALKMASPASRLQDIAAR